MLNSAYIKLGDIERTAKESFNETGKRLLFTDALNKTVTKNETERFMVQFEPSKRILDDDEFQEHLYSLPVDINMIFDHYDNTYVQEINLFAKHKNVVAIVNLPYIREFMHMHDYFEINYVYSGSCTCCIGDITKEYKAGSLIFIAPDVPHSIYSNDESILLILNLRKSTFSTAFKEHFFRDDIIGYFFKSYFNNKNSLNSLVMQVEGCQHDKALLQGIVDESYKDDVYSQHIMTNMLTTLFYQAARYSEGELYPKELVEVAKYSSDFPEIVKYVQKNYATVTLSELSATFHYSEVYISKLFKKNLDNNFAFIVQNLKLVHAAGFLANSNYRVSEIATMVGYDSAEYLSRAFKKKYGVTPSEYRKQH